MPAPIIYDADGSVMTREKLKDRKWDRPVAGSVNQLPRRETPKELLEEIRRTQEIANGHRLNEGTEQHSGDIMGTAEFRDRTARMVDMGRLVADPVYVKRVDWDKLAGSADKFYLFHQDLVWLFTGKKVDSLGQFFHTHLQTRDYPDLYRVMLPEPILHTTHGGAIDQSFVAMERGEIADLLARYIVWASFVRRYTAEQRARFKQRTGRDLMDEYYEVVGHKMDIRIVGRPVRFDLFLPSGMDYAMRPVARPGKPIEFVAGPPDPAVIEAGGKVFCGDYFGIQGGGGKENA